MVHLGLAFTGMLVLALGNSFAAIGNKVASDPFAPFLNSIPVDTLTLGETKSGSGAQAITTRRFTFPSRNRMNTVFAILSYPQQAGTYPGILMLHGGGSRAEDLASLTVNYAQRGYVALAIDLPGICGTDKVPNSTGPWKLRPLGESPRFEVIPGPEKSTLVDAEVAGLEAFNWLRSRPNVKPEAMGITGYSWGGYSTTILSGLLRDKVKAAYSVFGCGFYEKGSAWKGLIAGLSAADREVWLANLDAGRRAPDIKAAYFLEAASNDTFFWPEAVGATMDAVPGTKNHVWGPNLNHKQMDAGPTMQRIWFDYHLKGIGNSFPTVAIVAAGPGATTAGSVSGLGFKISILVKPPAGVDIASVEVWYSLTSAGAASPDWSARTWLSAKATVDSKGLYQAAIPDSLSAKKIDWFAYATDSRTVSTASPMYNTSQGTVGLTWRNPAYRSSRKARKQSVSGSIFDARGRTVVPRMLLH